MFAGYGGTSFALKKAEVEYKCVGYSEIDKFAIQCYEQNHGNVPNYGDCTKINPHDLPDFDLLTGGFPCQAFSSAGKGLGELDTRGTLVYDIIRIAVVKQPKYMLLENVKGFTFKKFKDTFNKVLNELDRIGYNVYWDVLNSKDYGVPQNRERVWFVCYRKDLKFGFEFPKKSDNNIVLKNILENDVEEKYYLSDKTCMGIAKSNYMETNPKNINKICSTIKIGGDIKCIKDHKSYISWEDPKNRFNTQDHRAFKEDMYSGTVPAMERGIPNVYEKYTHLRKLTPKECYRLMGFEDGEITLDGLSDTQKYKLAGNGWDVNLVSHIFKEMFKNCE